MDASEAIAVIEAMSGSLRTERNQFNVSVTVGANMSPNMSAPGNYTGMSGGTMNINQQVGGHSSQDASQNAPSLEDEALAVGQIVQQLDQVVEALRAQKPDSALLKSIAAALPPFVGAAVNQMLVLMGMPYVPTP